MSIALWWHLQCLSLNPALKSFISSSSSDSFITLSAIDSGLGSEGRVPGSLESSLNELESPSDAWVELVDRLDAEVVEVDGDLGVGVVTWIAFAIVFFFFFSVRGQAVDDEPRPFSPGALLNFPFCLFSSRYLRLFWWPFASASCASS